MYFKSVMQYYRHKMETNGSHSISTEIYKEKVLRNKSVYKATGIHELWGRFLKDGFTKTYK